MLTDAELAAMRETAEAALPDSAVITRKTTVSDGAGGGSVSWAASGTVDARLSDRAGNEQLFGTGLPGTAIFAQTDAILTVAHDIDLRQADRVTVDSTTYEVLAVLDQAAWTLAQRAAVKRVR